MTVEATRNEGTPIPGEGQVPVDTEAQEQLELERRARLHGWKDKTEFDRPPERWKPAAEFLATQENNLPVLKENLHRIETKLSATEDTARQTSAQLAAMSAAFDHMQNLAMTAEQRAYDRAKRDYDRDRASLEAAIDNAAATADVGTVRTGRQALASLKEPTPPMRQEVPRATAVRAPAASAVDPAERAAVDQFVSQERWFKTPTRGDGNTEATEFASTRYGTLRKERPELSPNEALAEVRKSVSKAYPDLFRAPGSGDPPRVAAPSGGNGMPREASGSTRGWNDLPADVRTQATKMIEDVNKGRKDKKTFTQAEYASLYFKGQ